MRIESLSLKGILRFADEISLDLRALPPGLIALVGPIGEGKSTILEAVPAVLYRQWPSRADRELYDYAHDRDSFLESDIALEGRGLYRARVNVDGVRRTSEAVLVHLAADGTQTVLNDGKVSTYSAAVREIFPDQDLLLASAFASQDKSGNFISLDRKRRKELFSTLLGLDHYERMAQTARTAAGLVDAGRGRLAAVRDLLARETGPDVEATIAERERIVATERAGVTGSRVGLQETLKRLDAERTALQDEVGRHQAAVARRGALAGEITWRTRDRDQAAGALATLDGTRDDEIRRIHGTLTQTRADLHRAAADDSERRRELTAIETRFLHDTADVDRRLGNNRGLLTDAEAIQAAAAAMAETQEAVTRWRERDRQLTEEAGRLRAEWDRLLNESHAIDLVRGRLEHATDASKLLGTVPCGGQEQFAACQFLKAAVKARTTVPDLQHQVDAGAMLSAQRQAVDAVLQRLVAEQAPVSDQIRLLTQQLAELDPAAKKLAALKAAEARIAELAGHRQALEAAAASQREAADRRNQARLEDLARQGERAHETAQQQQAEAEQRYLARKADLQAQVREQGERLRALVATLQEVEAEVSATAGAVSRMQALEAELVALRRQWDETTALLARLEAEAQHLARRRREFEARQAERADAETRLRALEAELLEWQLLAKALGRDGLPTLEIANAGPTVSGYCNDLLLTCFGPRFTVEIVTQEAKLSKRKAGDGMKETFSVLITDNERGGGARDIRDLSGGEKTIVSEALANAIALTVNARSRAPIRTCWRDETTGALNPEMVPRYIEMLRRVQQIGGYERIYFVTHSAEAADLADAQLRFGGGRVDVVVPPYQAAA